MKFHELLLKHIGSDRGARTDLAKRIGVSLTYIMNISDGKRPPPPIKTVRLMASELDLTQDQTDALLLAAARERLKSEELDIIENALRK